MFFNSFDFAVFLPLVFIIYWLVSGENRKLQNFILFVASYIFYGWWDWRFLSLMLFSTIVDYSIGRRLLIENKDNRRKILLWISIIVNLGVLGFFKYFNFFLENFVSTFSFLGVELNTNSLNIVLPVGISFYTFQTMSYTIDAYRGKLTPTRDFFAFATFVSFFPQLVAGPIERATNLLPQFLKKRKFDYQNAVDGMRQILWGLFKKVVVADNCAEYANIIFNNSNDYSGSTLFFGAILFAFQIYGDFSGYSDIAIGTSRLFGFNLRRNFAFPYFSRDIAEFWRRWHISLSTWFRDYLYVPLGGSKGGNVATLRNIFIIFLVSGFWHGANWTFIAWGGVNALCYIPLILYKKNRKNIEIVSKGQTLPSLSDFIKMTLTFGLTVLIWVLFRAENINHAWEYLSNIFSPTLFSLPEIRPKSVLFFMFILILVEWFGREQEHALEKIGLKWNRLSRWFFYSILIFFIGMYMETSETSFIYFQF